MSMKNLMLSMLLVPALVAGPVGCETVKENKRTSIGTAAGAALGGLAGGVIGHQSGNKWEGAAIGAATGALLGGGAGYYLDRRARDRFEEINDVDVVNEVPATAVPDAPADQPPPIERMTLRMSNDVLFAKSSSALTASGVQKVTEIANVMKDYPETAVIVRGYASSEGAEDFNQRLSEQRAKSVADGLVAYGKLNPARIVGVVGMGISNPIADNSTEIGRQQNRRVEIEVFPASDVR